MMSGLTRRKLSRSSASERRTSGGRFATTTSALATGVLTTSRPSTEDGSSVMPRLLRFMTTYIAPIRSSVIGATQRSSPPPIRSMRITSAPRSASSAAQYGPAMYRPKSSTRMPSRTFVIAPECTLLEREADVALGGDRLALLAVPRRAARVNDERALVLARHVGVDAHHPRVDLGEEHAPGGLVHVREPLALRLRRRLHARVPAVAHVGDQRRHPVHVLLDAARDIAERRGVVRPDERHEIWEAFDLQPQVRARAVRPLLA